MFCPNCPEAGGSLKRCCESSHKAFWMNMAEFGGGILLLVTAPIWIPILWFDEWRLMRRWNK